MRVTVVVVHQEQILLIREKSGGAVGYGLPGGNVEYLEGIPDAVRREVWEETGLLVEMDRLLWVDERIDRTGDGKHTVGIAVLAKLMGEDATPIPGGIEDEHIEWAGWVPLTEWKTDPKYADSRQEQVICALEKDQYKPAYLGNMLDKKQP
jgi:ADP-ribose pyrophosphatase YjhB (NUDIX family)